MPKVRDVDEAYIKSQENEGWECLPDLYDDRGYTGGNMERPALRTRDKISRLLGYDVDPHSKLIINDDEATRVRTIYELYLENQSIMATIKEIDRRGWTNKRWTTSKGHERGGFPFTKVTLFKMPTAGRKRRVARAATHAPVDSAMLVKSLLQPCSSMRICVKSMSSHTRSLYVDAMVR